MQADPVAGTAVDAGLVDFAFSASPLAFVSGRLGDALDLTWVSPNCRAVTGLDAADLVGAGGLERHIADDGLERYRAGLDTLRRLGRAEGTLCLRPRAGVPRRLRLRARVAAGIGESTVHAWLEAIDDGDGDGHGDGDGAGPPAAERAAPSLSPLLADALDRVPSALGLFDADGRLILCNAAFAAPYGALPGALVGLDQRALARDFLTRVARIDQRAITASEDDAGWLAGRLANPHAPPAEVQLKNGEWKLVSATAIGGGGVAVVRTDITHRKRVDEEMSRQREALHQSEKLSALGELLASVAHELNNPLSVVVGQALLMQETAADAAVVARAEKIGDAAARCSRIVKAFLAMARQQPLERTMLAPNAIVASGLELCAYTLRDSGIRVTRRLAADLPCVHGDGNQLAQVIINLVLNARYALRDVDGPREIRITSSHRARSGEVVIKVKDNGPGVPDAIRGRIFEPLFTTKEAGAGTGIGLALCHRIVAAHGGILDLESSPDGGATFCIRLPAAPAQDAACGAPAARAATPGRLQVLVIDDEPAVAEMLAEVAAAARHEVAVAHSAADALELMQSRSFDVVLSDVRMPGLDGPRFFEHLKRVHPEMLPRVVFVTGDALTPRVRGFLRRSGRPYLEKPVRPAEVRELLARVGAAAHAAEEGA